MRTLTTLTALALLFLLSTRGAAQGRRIATFPYQQPFLWVTSTTSSFPSSDVDGGEFALDAGTVGWVTSIQSHGLNNNGGAGNAIRIQPTAGANNGIAGFIWFGDFTARCGDSLTLDWNKIQASSTGSTRVSELRIGTNSGAGMTFTDIPIANIDGGAWPRFDNSGAPQSGKLRLKLPPSLNGLSDARIRIYSINIGGTGSLPRLVVDNLAITTIDAPSIIAGPREVTACEGETARFAVQAAGIGLSYQWRRNGLPIDGATEATFTIDSVDWTDEGSYDVIVTGACAFPTASSKASLNVLRAPIIIEEPYAERICYGARAKFRVSAVGSGLTYQWRRNGVPIEGATAAAYSIERARETDAGSYDVVVSGRCSPMVTSRAVELVIDREPIIAEQPLDQTVTLGASVTFTVRAYGTGQLRYQWQKNGVDIPDATGTSFTIRSVALDDAGGYSCVISNRCTPPMTVTNNAWLHVKSAAGIVAPSNGATACEGDLLRLSVGAVSEGMRYQWRKDGIDIAGANDSVLTITDATRGDGGSYLCVITPENSSPIMTQPVAVEIFRRTAITEHPVDQLLCGGARATFSVAAVGDDLRYQWRRNGVPIDGATERSYVIITTAASDSGAYDCSVDGACGEAIMSHAARLTIHPSVAIVEQPVEQRVLSGEAIDLRVAALGGELRYQWRKDGIPIPEGTASHYSISSAAPIDGGIYDVVVDGCSERVVSDAIRVIVEESPLAVPERTRMEIGPTLLVSPNPTDGSAQLEIRLPAGLAVEGDARLLLYDILGVQVADLSESFASGGYRRAVLDARSLVSGTYQCRLEMREWNGTLGSVVIVR